MKYILLLLMLFLSVTINYGQVTVTSIASGNFSNPAIWDGGSVPGTSDNVVIADGHTVSLDGANNWTIADLTIGQGSSGIINYASDVTAANSLTINGNLTLSASAQFVLGSLPSVQPNIFIKGNITIGNGATFDLGSGSSKGIITNFIRTTSEDQTISQSGTATNIQFNKIVVNRQNTSDRVVADCNVKLKGGNYCITLTKGTYEQISGTLQQTSTSATNIYLGTNNGILKISGSANFYCTSSIVGASGSNGSDAPIIINTSGTFTVGGLSNQARLQNSNTLTIMSGTINIGGRFTISNVCNISGGNINIDPQGSYTALSNTSNCFEVQTTGSLTMSGGTITVIDPIQATGTGLEIKLSTTATYNITGGTIRVGDGISTTNGADGFQVSTHTVPLWNVEFNGNSTSSSRIVTLTDGSNSRNIVVKNNLNINSGTVNANYAATGSNITFGGSFTNNGTLNLGTNSTFILNGTSNQITGSTFPNTIPNLSLVNSSGVTISNSISLSGNLTLGGNANYSNLENISGYIGLTYSATVPQTTGNELSSSITNLSINNTNGVTLSNPITVTGTLSVANGDLNCNGNLITLGTTGIITETSGNTVLGSIQTTRTLVQNTNEVFGGLGIEINAIDAAPGSTTVLRSTGVSTSGNGNQGIKRYFEINPTANSGLNATLIFKYDSTELNNIAEQNLVLFKSEDNGANWTLVGGTVDTTLNSVSLTGVNSFSRWTLGDATLPLPVELSTFTAMRNNSTIELSWITTSETNNAGFEIQRKNGSEWNVIGFIKGNGYSNSLKKYSFIDTKINSSTKYYYRLRQIDNNGLEKYSNIIESIGNGPKNFTLLQNYPNPFNPNTKISFEIPTRSNVQLKLYNAIGRQVMLLLNEIKDQGSYSINFSAENLNSGIYFCVMKAGNFSSTIKMILIK